MGNPLRQMTNNNWRMLDARGLSHGLSPRHWRCSGAMTRVFLNSLALTDDAAVHLLVRLRVVVRVSIRLAAPVPANRPIEFRQREYPN